MRLALTADLTSADGLYSSNHRNGGNMPDVSSALEAVPQLDAHLSSDTASVEQLGGDFAIGQRLRPLDVSRGDFGTGMRHGDVAAVPHCDFATGMRAVEPLRRVAGHFATGQGLSELLAPAVS
jgi:hypothetical protein